MVRSAELPSAECGARSAGCGVWIVELVVVELYIPRSIYIDIPRDDLAECVKYPTTSGTCLCPIEI